MRLVLVSNRLPLTISTASGHLDFTPSVGGLTSGIADYVNCSSNTNLYSDYIWVGWPGATPEYQAMRQAATAQLRERKLHPIFLTNTDIEQYYNHFCNRIMWPLLHGMPVNASYSKASWQSYKQVNEKFFKEISSIIQPEDIVWIHDYHLMLLPGLIKQVYPNVPVGFFLHVPFPSAAYLDTLQNKFRGVIAESILSADLVGFHTEEYLHNFFESIKRISDTQSNYDHVIYKGKYTSLGVFPMGVDYAKYLKLSSNLEVSKIATNIQITYKDISKLTVISRLEPTKGILQALMGYKEFLQQNHGWHNHIVLSLVVVPSRMDSKEHQDIKRQIDELVGYINGEFGAINWTPVIYQFRALDIQHLVALYQTSDVMIIPSVSDGMNLIAKEYISVKQDGNGVLILSQYTGAAKELTESIVINPYNSADVADAIKQSLHMKYQEKKRRIGQMQDYLNKHNVCWWGQEFMSQLLISGSRNKPVAKAALS